MVQWRKIICFFFFSFGAANLAQGQDSHLPKVGDRVYVIKKNSSDPVAIKKEAERVKGDQVVLRDPTLLTTDRPKPAPVKPAPIIRVKPRKVRNGQISFKPAKINGNMKNPRVEFKQEYLKVGISEESYGADFFQKVNEPLTDSNF